MSIHKAILLAAATLTHAWGGTPSTVTVTASPNPSVFGQQVTLTATVTPAAATGAVTFYDGQTILWQASLSAGVARLNTILLSAGSRSPRAYYAGDSTYNSATSASIVQVVNAAVENGFTQTFPFTLSALSSSTPIVGDFNGDGKADVAVVDNTGGVRVLIGDGRGGLTAAAGSTTVPVSFSNSFVLAIGDFNSDGRTDLAVVVLPFSGTTNLYVFLGDGLGGLTQTGSPFVLDISSGIGLSAGDFNGDGKTDLAIAGSNSTDSKAMLYVFNGNGSGGFTQPAGSPFQFSGLFRPTSVAVGDFNGDGKADLAMACHLDTNSQSAYALAVLLGDGTSHFSSAAGSPYALAGSTGKAPVVAADFNNDGNTDLAVGLDASIYAFLGNGTGGFTLASGSPSNGSAGSTMFAGDFNGDGVVDLIGGGVSSDPARVFANLGNGSGVFTWNRNYTMDGVALNSQRGGDSRFMAIGDFNGDGKPDVVNAGNLSGAPGEYMLLGAQSPCIYSLDSAGINFDAGPGTASVNLTATPTSCAWTVRNLPAWLTMTTPASGTGGASFGFSLADNATRLARTASVLIGDKIFTILQGAFHDVQPTDFFYDAVNRMANYSITAGCNSNPTQYCPASNISRGEMAIFIVRAATGGDNFTFTSAPYFTDVPSTHPYFKWIQKMRDLGITAGCGANVYCPDAAVTRGQMAVFIVRARVGSATVFAYSSSPLFTDVPGTYPFFSWIQKMKQVGITAGCSATTYCPEDPVTRGQMAIFIMRGGFNQLLAAGTALVSSISPSVITTGGSANVVIGGANSNFVQGTTTISAGPNITVSNITVVSGQVVKALFTANASAVAGRQSVIVTTGSEEAVLPNGITVQ